jgi:hypothetical protein
MSPYRSVRRAVSVTVRLAPLPAVTCGRTKAAGMLTCIRPAAVNDSAAPDVIVKPAQVFSGRARKLEIEPALVEQLAGDAQGADALPLLAFTLEKLFDEFGADGKLTLVRYDGMRGVGGSIRPRAHPPGNRRALPARQTICGRNRLAAGTFVTFLFVAAYRLCRRSAGPRREYDQCARW